MKTADGTRIRVKSELIEWFAARIAQRIPADVVARTNETLHSIIVRGDTIYSFGSHFPMGTIVRNPNGRAVRVILNGDSWPARGFANTSGDQSDLRGNVNRVISELKFNVDVMIVPFSAITAAGISRENIVPIHVRPDRHTYEEYRVAERPGPLVQEPTDETYMVDVQRHGYVNEDGTPAESSSDPGARWGTYTAQESRPVMREVPNEARVDHRHGHGWAEGYAELKSDGMWHYTVKRHWLGDAVFRALTVEQRVRNARPAEREVYDTFMLWHAEWSRLRRERDAAQTHYAYAKHELDHQHGRTMAEVPGGELKTVDAEFVARAEAKRDETQAAFLAHAELHPPTNEVEKRGDQYIVRYTVRRWATYLSSFDYGEPHRPYFLCELPYGARPKTVDEAIDCLMPDEVRTAIDTGLNVLRQGDVFCIPTAYTTDELESRAKAHGRRVFNDHCSVCGEDRYHHLHSTWVKDSDIERHEHAPIGHVEKLVKQRSKVTDGDAAQVLGTNHAPTHMIQTKDGQFFGRGRLYHTPSGRDADHRVVELGDRETWYRLVKNTVPTAKTSRNRTHTSGGGNAIIRVNQSQSRAWMLGGSVD